MQCGNKKTKMAKKGMDKEVLMEKKSGKKYAKGGKVRGTGCATKGTNFSGEY